MVREDSVGFVFVLFVMILWWLFVYLERERDVVSSSCCDGSHGCRLSAFIFFVGNRFLGIITFHCCFNYLMTNIFVR